MKKFSLNGIWNMQGNGYNLQGEIPGSVYSFLHIDNNLLPDPHFGDNEKIYTELMENDYSFSREFEFTPSKNKTFLVFEGLDTLCSVYLNGRKIADTDNMHVKYSFAVNDFLLKGKNTIKVTCHSVNQFIRKKDAEQKLFGATDCMRGYPHVRKTHCMMGWDWGPRLPDAGIWKNVYLLEENSSQIVDVHVFQRHDNGKVYITPKISIKGDGEVSVCITSPSGGEFYVTPNEESEIENAQLWMPNGYGKQNLYKIEVFLTENGEKVDEKILNVGLRTLSLVREKDEDGESFYHLVNGIPIFAMGADYIPEDNIFSRINRERTEKLLLHCKNSNFNAIRVWGGGYYPDDFFFDICDRLGLIVFLDLAFACSVYDPSEEMKKSIACEVTQNLSRIRHHACIGLVCGNNEIEWHFHEYVAISGRTDGERLEKVYLELFEKTFPKIINEVAPYIPYIPSSPTSTGGFCNPNKENVGDCHDWELDYILCRNKVYRYVSEFGFEGFPGLKTIQSFTKKEDRVPFSRIMDVHHRSCGGNEVIMTYLCQNYRYPKDFSSFIYTSQLLQAEAVKYKIEHLRRNRGKCMGALYWQLNDIWPCTSWASIDYYGRFKALQYFAKRFFSPILISCEEVGELQNKRFINAEKGSYNVEKSAVLCVTNDTLNDLVGTVKWKVLNAKSQPIVQGIEDITVKALSVKRLEKLNFESINPQTDHLYYCFEKDGKVLSEGSVLFTQTKYYAFENPNLTYTICGNQITVKSSAYAKSVQIEGEDGDIITSDNFFDMEKGEKTVTVVSGKTEKIILRSIYEISND